MQEATALFTRAESLLAPYRQVWDDSVERFRITRICHAELDSASRLRFSSCVLRFRASIPFARAFSLALFV